MHETYRTPREPLPPADTFDPVIEAYKKDVDRTLLRNNLKLTVDQRARQMLNFIRALDQLRGIATRQASKKSTAP